MHRISSTIQVADTSQLLLHRTNAGCSGSRGSSREREGEVLRSDKVTRKHRRTLRRALEKARIAAQRLTLEALVGVKAFDGPPLGPADIRDLFLRNFRVRLSFSEAEAIITHFTPKVMGSEGDYKV